MKFSRNKEKVEKKDSEFKIKIRKANHFLTHKFGIKLKELVLLCLTLILVLIVALMVINNQQDKYITFTNYQVTTEYGSTVDAKKYILKVSDNANVSYPNVDKVNAVGKYIVSYGASTSDKNVTQQLEIDVKDKTPATVSLADATAVGQVKYNGAINIAGNLNIVNDEIDGDFSDIKVVSPSEMDTIEKQVTQAHTDKQNRQLSPDSEPETTVVNDVANNYVVVTSNIDTSTPGLYAVKAVAIDSNYNTTYAIWEVEVLSKGEAVTFAAPGTNGSVSGALGLTGNISYSDSMSNLDPKNKITDTTEADKNTATTEEQQTNTTNTNQTGVASAESQTTSGTTTTHSISFYDSASAYSYASSLGTTYTISTSTYNGTTVYVLTWTTTTTPTTPTTPTSGQATSETTTNNADGSITHTISYYDQASASSQASSVGGSVSTSTYNGVTVYVVTWTTASTTPTTPTTPAT